MGKLGGWRRNEKRGMDKSDRRVQQINEPAGTDYAARQRTALSEMVTLGEQAETLEADLQQRHVDVDEAVQRRYSRVARRLETRQAAVRDAADQKRNDELADAQTQRDQALKRAKDAHAHQRQALAEALENEARQQKRALDEARWLADSVLEAAQNGTAKRYQQRKAVLHKQAQSLEAASQHAAELVQWYRQSPDQVGEPGAPRIGDDVDAAYAEHRQALDERLESLSRLWVRWLLPGARPAAVITIFCIVAVGLAVAIVHALDLSTTVGLIALASTLGGALIVAATAGWAVHRLAGKTVRRLYVPVLESLACAQAATHAQLQAARDARDQTLAAARTQHTQEREAAEAKYKPRLDELTQQAQQRTQKIEADFAAANEQAEQTYRQKRDAIEQQHTHAVAGIESRYANYLQLAQQRRDDELTALNKKGAARRNELVGRWRRATQQIASLAEEGEQLKAILAPSWDTAHSLEPQPPAATGLARFGQLQVRVDPLMREGGALSPGNDSFTIPAVLKLPEQGCLLVEASDHHGRGRSVAFLQMLMARLLISLPAGRARFTLIDPVGLGEHFAGFMHLADYDEKLIGGRVWTDSEHIERRLTDLTRHMENVLQKYLRNDFQTIDEYNAQAGELAEPYRFVVVCDFPVNFSEEAARRLNSIVTSGPRCGVFPLIFHDARHQVPSGIALEDVRARAINLVHTDAGLQWRDDLLGRFALKVDQGPSEAAVNRLMERIGEAAKEASRVEVPFETLAPQEQSLWTADASDELRVPIGRAGATRSQELRLGKGMAQHVLVAGKTGSGKSTLLHTLITSLAIWYSPEQVEFYLVDFKKGVEFKSYASAGLPHARAVAIESEREFGLSVLRRLDNELERRGELFRDAGVQDLPTYRRSAADAVMPRTLLIVDEFQELFSQDDAIAQEAAMLLDRLVRQGRAFGVHVLLGSQTLGGSGGLFRSTLGQMNVRIALQCNESDSQLIFDDRNTAAQLLDRPGEAIYNDAGGMVEGNSPFQIAWLDGPQRDRRLAHVAQWSREHGRHEARPIVFEGSAIAKLSDNQLLHTLLASETWPALTEPPVAWLGEPITIKAPTCATLAKRPGANLLVVGQREDAAGASLAASMISLAAQHAPGQAAFYLLDASTANSPTAGALAQVGAVLPHETRIVGHRQVETAIAELDALCNSRTQEAHREDDRDVYVIILGLQRYRALRQRADSFGLSFDDSSESAAADQQFANLLREGSSAGIHLLVWCDTVASLDRTVDRQLLREFDWRVLFQMSAADSSHLVDSTLGNQLGLHRALLYSEEQGLIEKFRPYAPPDRAWLDWAGKCFASRRQDVDALGGG